MHLETNQIHERTPWRVRFCQELRWSLTKAVDLILKCLQFNIHQRLASVATHTQTKLTFLYNICLKMQKHVQQKNSFVVLWLEALF